MCGVRARHLGKAARAARTAASMSADEPWATDASFTPLEGSTVSKYSPPDGAGHAPLMKCPKRWPWRCSQACASFGSSGAGPYSIVAKFSAMLIQVDSTLFLFWQRPCELRDRMSILGRIATGRMVLQLPLDIAQQPARTKTKKLSADPRLPKLFFHHGQPVRRLFGSANPPGRLEAHSHPCLLRIFADGAGHHKAHRQRGVDRFFAG